MLVLTRYEEQAILIGDDVRLTVLLVDCGPGAPKVKLGFEAPREVRIVREEIAGSPRQRPPEPPHVPPARIDRGFPPSRTHPPRPITGAE